MTEKAGKDMDIDTQVVRDFGSEWNRFNQSKLSSSDLGEIFDNYFQLFPWDNLPTNSIGADIGCGSGRWASLVAPKVGYLYLVEPSKEALSVARKNLPKLTNISFCLASAENLPFEDNSLDFAYSLGVLHHVLDTQKAICSIARVLKPGVPFLIYLYYAFDNRPWWYRFIWRLSDMFRRLISGMPAPIKNFICECIALLIYLPLARTALLLERLGKLPGSWPLAYYRSREYYVMRTDALDRFGTRLEKRFSRQEIETMLKSAGFINIRFSESQPFWCALGIKNGNKEH